MRVLFHVHYLTKKISIKLVTQRLQVLTPVSVEKLLLSHQQRRFGGQKMSTRPEKIDPRAS